MGRPALASYAAVLLGPGWPGACLVCGEPLTRAWWQRGPLTPLPLCARGERGLCHDRGVRRGWL